MIVTTTQRWRSRREQGIRCVLFACAVLSVVTTFGILAVLCRESFSFFSHETLWQRLTGADDVTIWGFLTGTHWAPLLAPRSFGVLPLLCGTLLVTSAAAIIAVPLGVSIAIYLSEYASTHMRSGLKPVLEILAGIPTVVYGYFALTVVTPCLRQWLPATQVFNAASAAIVVAIMVLPMIASLCDDALRAVPQHLRQAGYALGATKCEVTLRIVLPGAMSGVLAACMLAIARAVGETMAVALAAGSTPKLTWNLLESVQTMTAYIVQVSLGDTPAGTIEYQSIFAVGMLLFVMTLAMNLVSHRILRRFREVYE